jgi:hypothetical protein
MRVFTVVYGFQGLSVKMCNVPYEILRAQSERSMLASNSTLIVLKGQETYQVALR